MVFDDNRGKLVLFGGVGGPPLNDTWEYDSATRVWTQIAPGGDPVEPRYRHEAAFAADLGTAFFFGGQTTGFTNDLLLLSVARQTAPRISSGGIGDVFSGAGGPFAAGEIVAIYGTSLGPPTGVSSAFDPVTSTLPNTSADVSVAVNGISAPLYYVSSAQVNIQIPYEVDGRQQASIAVNYNGIASAAEAIRLTASAPRLYPGVFSQDGSLNSTDNPASAGGIVTLFATGQGMTSPQGTTGKAAMVPYPRPVGAVRVTIGGLDAEVVFVGLAPGTAGVTQLNVRLPPGIAENKAAEVVLSIGDANSQKGVTVAVQ